MQRFQTNSQPARQQRRPVWKKEETIITFGLAKGWTGKGGEGSVTSLFSVEVISHKYSDDTSQLVSSIWQHIYLLEKLIY